MRRARRVVLRACLAAALAVVLALLLGVLVPRGPAPPIAFATAQGAAAEPSARPASPFRPADPAAPDGTHGPAPDLGAAAGQGSRVLLLSGPIHTDLALPLDAATRARFAPLAPHGVPLDDPAARWLVVGWGGRSFYLETPTWADLRPGPVLRSLGWDASVLHVTVAGPLDESHPAVLPLDLPPEARARLEAAVLASFALSDGRPVPVDAPAYPWPSRFFEAHGGFNLLLGCNTWTAAILREGGLATGLWTPLPQTLLASLRLHAP